MIRRDRAVSSAVTYSLVLGITLALTAGLVIGADSLVSAQREQAVENQLNVIAERTGSSIAAVDQMGSTTVRDDPDVIAGPRNASVTIEFPRRVAGEQYRIHIVRDAGDDSRGYLWVNGTDIDVDVRTPIRVRWADELANSQVNGGPIKVVFDPNDMDDPDDDQMVIRSAR